MEFSPRFALVALLVLPAIIYLIFMMPPLTSGGGGPLPGVSQAELEQAVNAEYAYCRASDTNVDCACFAQKSGVILSSNGPRVQGLVYAEKRDLARGQAEDGC